MLHLFAFMQVMSGFCFLYRTLSELVKKQIIQSSVLTKIGTTFVFWLVAGVFVIQYSYLWFCIWLYSPVLLVAVSPNLIRRLRANAFKKRISPVLTKIVLHMHTGKGFREAMKNAIAHESSNCLTKWQQIFDVVVFSQQSKAQITDSITEWLLKEFTYIDQHPHCAIEHLKNVQQKLRIESNFRRRSGQVMRQIRTQSWVLTALYLPLLGFVLLFMDGKNHFDVILISLMFFVLGLFWVQWMGRRYKWKV